MREGREAITVSMTALQNEDGKIPPTPFRRNVVDWKYLAERQVNNILRMEAQLELAREYLEKLTEQIR